MCLSRKHESDFCKLWSANQTITFANQFSIQAPNWVYVLLMLKAALVYIANVGACCLKELTGLQVRVGALVQGVLDVSAASPRRFFFEVLQHFATSELEVDRLEYFATPAGRDDLYTYNQKEGLFQAPTSCRSQRGDLLV